jgi:hypothetical protein
LAAAVGRAVLALLLLAVVALAGCGGEDAGGDGGGGAQLAVPWVDPDGEPPYIGSLSVNPADSALFMATNTGLFRVHEGTAEPERISGRLSTPEGDGEISEALVTRFTGPDELLASGHPAAGQALPPVLGLVRSDDAGKTWTPVSQLGQADFHTLDVSQGTLVAALYGQAQVLVSTDEGRTWETKTAPMPLVDLAVDPGDPKRWIATSERGIFVTTDGGQTWRQHDATPNVRIDWPEGGDVHRIDPGGPLKTSPDGGESWEDAGDTGGEPQALLVDGETVYVALFDGTLKVSEDGGATFTDRLRGG